MGGFSCAFLSHFNKVRRLANLRESTHASLLLPVQILKFSLENESVNLFAKNLKPANSYIDFTLIEVGPVKTGMNKKDYPFTCLPDDFASECINLVGRYSYIQDRI